jgi:hypothetical protein
MKRSLIIVFAILATLNSYGQMNARDLFCKKWIQFGFKSNSEVSVRILKEDCSKKKCEFSKDGKYFEDMFCLKGYGTWAFNQDFTKFGYQFTEYMGQKIENKLPIAFTELIIKLTPDTLIVGQEAYYGNSKVYGHDDYYFVRVK